MTDPTRGQPEGEEPPRPAEGAERLLPPGTTAWALDSGLAGHRSHCQAITSELGLIPILKPVRTSGIFSALSPYAPIDPRDAPGRPGSPIAPPFPDIAFASGRRTVPYLRRLRAAAGQRTFTVFLEDPRVGAGLADLIWVPEHDRLRGDNVIVTLTPPNPLRPALLAAARAAPDRRIAALAGPRAALIVGGPSLHHRFTPDDDAALAGIALSLLARGYSIMATSSRRTAESTLAALRAVFAGAPRRCFLWDGTGDNPYVAMIANADAIVVTGDSVNMVSEAVSTSAPAYVYEPSGGHSRLRRYLDALVARGVLRRWSGDLDAWSHEPVDSTRLIAAEIARRYAAFKRG